MSRNLAWQRARIGEDHCLVPVCRICSLVGPVVPLSVHILAVDFPVLAALEAYDTGRYFPCLLPPHSDFPRTALHLSHLRPPLGASYEMSRNGGHCRYMTPSPGVIVLATRVIALFDNLPSVLPLGLYFRLGNRLIVTKNLSFDSFPSCVDFLLPPSLSKVSPYIHPSFNMS